MAEHLTTQAIRIQIPPSSAGLLQAVEASVLKRLDSKQAPIRFAVTHSDVDTWHCEVDVHVGDAKPESIFRFIPRHYDDAASFNIVMLVPTGIGAEIGGHAGDASPAAALLANCCDTLITHPNVLNASDLIQIPENTLYVEGSVIAKMLMGTSRLIPVRSNRLLVIVQDHEDRLFTEAAVNAVNAARAYFGLSVTEIVMVDPVFTMKGEYSTSGSAGGTVQGIDQIWEILDARIGEFDAVALTSVIEIPSELHSNYYRLEGNLINPWGGVEAMLTHSVSLKYGVPTAHSPMFESREIAEMDVGIVDSRMAAEVISLTFFESVLRGLQRSPRIVDLEARNVKSLGAEDISCLIIPDGCLGLPTLAALHQGIKVIAVKENSNIMRNDLARLPWEDGQFFQVENYWEAVGVAHCLRAGLDPSSVRRPLAGVPLASNRQEADLPLRSHSRHRRNGHSVETQP